VALAVWLLAIVMVACSSSTTSPTVPTLTPPTITQTFNGTLAVQGESSNNFTVGSAGEVRITLTSVGPPPIAIGVGLGSPSGLTCVLSFGSGAALTTLPGTTPQITGTALAGTFCVEVYDVGNLTAATNYSVTVFHP
jgi:hypothetical protein